MNSRIRGYTVGICVSIAGFNTDSAQFMLLLLWLQRKEECIGLIAEAYLGIIFLVETSSKRVIELSLISDPELYLKNKYIVL